MVDDGLGGKKVQLKLFKPADIDALLKTHAAVLNQESSE
jgi:hypothetical protein